jgi:hypothetical protein
MDEPTNSKIAHPSSGSGDRNIYWKGNGRSEPLLERVAVNSRNQNRSRNRNQNLVLLFQEGPSSSRENLFEVSLAKNYLFFIFSVSVLYTTP